jgi:hypothetical protein
MGICGANDHIRQSAQFLGGRALFSKVTKVL